MTLQVRIGSIVALAVFTAACSSGSSSGGGTPLSNACSSHDGEGLNREAIALSSSISPDNACMELHQYNLFAPNEAEGFLRGDPRRPLVVEGEYQGLPYVLNTALFSEYTAKHRIVFLPKDENGSFIPATYRDADSSPDGEPDIGDLAKANDNFLFPVGTVIAKTFTYPDTRTTPDSERVIETRLLLKHTNTSDGSERWEGLAYVWTQDESTGEWIARRQGSGGIFDEARTWHYPDPNGSGLLIEGNNTVGENPYLIPSRDNCLTCHSNADQDAGTAPIGLKARYLNRPYASEFDTFTNDPVDLVDSNQIDYWDAQDWLEQIPQGFAVDAEQIANVERIQPYNIPGDDTDPEADLAARARGYLEVNCAHCHNEMRRISPTGVPSAGVEDFYLEFQRDFCSANLFAQGNINPGYAADGVDDQDEEVKGSDLFKRINTPGDEQVNAGGGDPMPRLARQLIHAEGVAVIGAWIDNMPTDICEP